MQQLKQPAFLLLFRSSSAARVAFGRHREKSARHVLCTDRAGIAQWFWTPALCAAASAGGDHGCRPDGRAARVRARGRPRGDSLCGNGLTDDAKDKLQSDNPNVKFNF